LEVRFIILLRPYTIVTGVLSVSGKTHVTVFFPGAIATNIVAKIDFLCGMMSEHTAKIFYSQMRSIMPN
jgi:hypothetical protein